ncbi:MAG TPA: hypothetical protein VMS81_01815 [Methanomicrobiales archaeon]|jgi:hypothetical protein|nr:hypothetical protein [Methanomicrobiales archaeon]
MAKRRWHPEGVDRDLEKIEVRIDREITRLWTALQLETGLIVSLIAIILTLLARGTC